MVGPIGVGIYSQLSNISGLLTSILPIGSIGLMRYFSEYFKEGKSREISYLIKFFFIRNFVVAILLSGFTLFFSEYLSSVILTDSSYQNLLIIFSLSIPASLLFNFIDIFLKSSRRITNYVIFQTLCALTNIVINVPLIIFFGLTGAVIGIVLSGVLNSIIGIVVLKKIKIFPDLKLISHVDKGVIKDVFWFGVSSMISLVVMQFTLLLIKINLGDKLGLEAVGIFQSVYSISVSYFGIFFGLLGTYSIPKLSTFKNNEEFNDELNTTLKFLLIIYTPIIISVFIFRTFLITLLYSDEFLLAKDLLLYQLIGDFLKAMGWTFGLWLIPKVKIKQWLTFDIVTYTVFYSSFYIFLYILKWDIKSVSIAYMISFFAHFTINFIYTKKSLQFKFSQGNLKYIIVSILVLVVAFTISVNSEFIGYFALLPLLIFWFLFSVSKKEIQMIKGILQSKIKK